MKIQIFLILFLSLSLSAFENKNNLSLAQFTNEVSFISKKNILISSDINTSISYNFPDLTNTQDVFNAYNTFLSLKGYYLIKRDSIYILNKKSSSSSFYSYKIKNNSYKDLTNYLNFKNIKNVYMNDSNIIYFESLENNYEHILNDLISLDVQSQQVTLKITIFEYSSSDIQERGISSFSRSSYDSNFNLESFLSSIISPVSSSTLTYQSTDFNLALSFLDTEGVINIKQSPYVLARNNDKFVFKAVQNIPFKTSTTTTESANTSQNESIQYKDVGLKIDGIAFIYDDYVSLDLSLIVEDIISQSQDNIPQTYKRELKSLSNVNYGDVLLLSGLKRTKREINDYSIPYLSGIPYLGSIFQYTNESETELNIAISIEVLPNGREDYALDLRELANEIKAE
ncbi:MAG: hypothetical protein RBR54_06415 [Sulfurimonas sp.]|jgi:general secretion pathway protein D|nr:hypothetical protein [Sulfurimonas sp.]